MEPDFDSDAEGGEPYLFPDELRVGEVDSARLMANAYELVGSVAAGQIRAVDARQRLRASGGNCVICLELVYVQAETNGVRVAQLPCGDIQDVDCMRGWVNATNGLGDFKPPRCPCCNTDLRADGEVSAVDVTESLKAAIQAADLLIVNAEPPPPTD
ncbi:MAG: hypothetical protein M3N95_13745 [Actinomycetota bacterium]|nr:hypothetical protein [Actinomycetota bacterium]